MTTPFEDALTLKLSETDWPLSYNDRGLLIGPLRMERQYFDSKQFGRLWVWVYCWNDPGVKERVNEQLRAIIDQHGKARYEP